MLTDDLAQLAADIETATAHQTPPWQDSLNESQLRQLLRRAEQIAAADRTIRALMRKPG